MLFVAIHSYKTHKTIEGQELVSMILYFFQFQFPCCFSEFLQVFCFEDEKNEWLGCSRSWLLKEVYNHPQVSFVHPLWGQEDWIAGLQDYMQCFF